MARVKPVVGEMLSSKIKDRILKLIIEGDLEPGECLVETRIARDFGVSQSPVREAIRDLAGVGFLAIVPYRGARVRRFTRHEFVDDMEIRGELEAIAARRAVERISDGEIAQLRGLVEEMRELARQRDVHGQAVKNTEFHRTIVAASGSNALLRAWTVLEPFARTYMTAMVPGIDLVWLGDRHEAIVDALEARDAELAASVMTTHAAEARRLLADDEASQTTMTEVSAG